MSDTNEFTNEQIQHWTSKFGELYLDRNFDPIQIDLEYKKILGISHYEIFSKFFNDLPRELEILEVGCNVGLNINILKKMDFQNLSGLDINKNALSIAKERYPDVIFYESSIESFNTKKRFDLVFTMGVLIHIHPDLLSIVTKKIHNLSKNYIFGYEYFAEHLTPLKYREKTNLMWKGNYLKFYLEQFPNLSLIKEIYFPYIEKNLKDIGFLLRKT